VAVVTKLIDGVAFQQVIGHRLVGIVTTGTRHLALSHRVYRRFEIVCTLLLVARITNIGLLIHEQYFVLRRMRLMTVGT
jgi:hypothetical protein